MLVGHAVGLLLTLLIDLVDGELHALVGQLLGLGLGRALQAAGLLQLDHVGLVAEHNHVEEARLGMLNLFHIEAHVVELVLQEQLRLVLGHCVLIHRFLESPLVVLTHQVVE